MKWLKIHNLVLAIGLVVTFYGLANAVSVVSAISFPGEKNGDQTDDALSESWPDEMKNAVWSDQPGPSLEQADESIQLEALPMPSTSFLAQAMISQGQGKDDSNDQLLSDMFSAEMLSPQESIEQLATLATPIAPEIPIRLIIPAIELDTPVLPAEAEAVAIAGKNYQLWRAPDEFAAGWHVTSATLGVIGNTVLNGHHNVHGEVFKRLVELNPGDRVIVDSESASYHYIIVNRMILPEKYAPLADRIENSRWIMSSEDERLTLITCWPYESNSHRLILVARPDA
jgi:LPXTG-site transpeptidase (sortase) family protein